MLQDLGELVAAMRPFLDQAVLCGGWAAYLYRCLPGVSVASAPLLTKDFDWALPRDLGTMAGSLDACLVSGSFVSVPCGDSIPAVTRYQHERWGRDQLGPVYAELLVPLHGAALDRTGGSRSVVELTGHGGATAQALRFLELLLEGTIEVDLGDVQDLPLPKGSVVQIPHPANYAIQKCLAIPKRNAKDRDKDFAYLFETAVCTRRTWASLKDRVAEIEGSSKLHGTWLRRVRADLARWYRDAASDGVVGACRVIRSVPERASTTESQVERIMDQFLSAIGLR